MAGRRGVALACAAAFTAAFAVYVGALDDGWTWDDHVHVEGPFLHLRAPKEPRPGAELFKPGFWTGREPAEGSGRPALLASFAADAALWGGDPEGWHLSSVLTHAAAAAAVAAFAAAALASPAAGAAAGLLFALHPAQSEAVCGIAFRADLLAALFCLSALVLRRRASAWRLGASCACLGMALLSKENAAVWPALAILDEILSPSAVRTKGRWLLIQTTAFFLVFAAYAAFRATRGGYDALSADRVVPSADTTAAMAALELPGPGSAAGAAAAAPSAAEAPRTGLNPLDRAPEPRGRADGRRLLDPSPPPWAAELRTPGARLRAASGVLLDYARLTAWPAGLQADRSAALPASWKEPRAWGGAVLLAALLAAAAGLRRRLPAFTFGVLWWLAALVPVSGVVPLYNLEAERYLYLPLAGAALAAAALFEEARRARRPVMAWALLAGLLAPAALATVRRVPAWKDDVSLFGGEVVSDGGRLRYNRARLAREQGRLDDAAAEYRRALELAPGSVEALVNLAEVEGARGRPQEELALLRRAVAQAPANAVARAALGAAEEKGGHAKAALEHYMKAVYLDPKLPLPHRLLGNALYSAGRKIEARWELEKAALLDHYDAQTFFLLGRMEQEDGHWEECADYMRRATRLDPKNGLAFANWGVCLHQEGLAKGGGFRLQPAIWRMQKAAALLPANPVVRRNLGAVEADMGKLEEAQQEYGAALTLEPRDAAIWHDYAVVLQRRGRLEEAGAAYERAIALEPARVESLVNLAMLRGGARRFDEAQALLARAEAARPGDPTTQRAAEALARAVEAAGN